MKKAFYLILEGYGEIEKFKRGNYNLDLNKLFTSKKEALKHFNKVKKENKQNDCFYKFEHNIHITQLVKEVVEGENLKEELENTILLDSEIFDEYIENKNGKLTL